MNPGGDWLESARKLEPQLVAWRRAIHMHPELGFEETQTAALAASVLESLGIAVRTGVGTTGVIGVLGSGRPAIGLRADMDALPIQEAAPVPFASQTPGVMHACGHDAHVAMLLGAATLLSKAGPLPGEIRFLFQPSEERANPAGKTGAALLIEDGALDGLARLLALHVKVSLPAGQIEITPGYALASGDYFEASILGKGCHDSAPQEGVDPIYILAQVINAIYGIRARRIDPLQPGTISIGSVHGGQKGNVVPGEVKINGTIRALSDDVRRQMTEELARALNVARALGGDYQLAVRAGLPSTYNDPLLAQIVRQAVVDLLGEDAVAPPAPALGVEDFGLLTRRVPGVIAMLGARPGATVYPHHSPNFEIDESCLPLGAAVLASAALRLLSAH